MRPLVSPFAPRRAVRLASCFAVASLSLLAACQPDTPAASGPYAAHVAKAIPLVEKATGLKF